MKRNPFKRSVAMLLVIALLVTVFPTSALAFSGPVEDLDLGSPQDTWDLGDGLQATRYYKYENGTSTFSLVIHKDPSADDNATFRMSDYSNASDAPWSKDNYLFRNIYIEDGVEHIGANAFNGFTAVTYAEIPSSVTSIGASAFRGMSQAEFSDGTDDGTLNLSAVSSLGEYVFSGCSKITGVTLNENLSAIPAYAFNSTGLTDVEIPMGVTSIGNSAFASCSNLNTISLPSSVETIGSYAFSGAPLRNMESLTLPENLTTVGDHAFYRSTDNPQRTIKSIVIGKNVTTIDAYAFYNFRALETVEVYAENLEKPGTAAFGNGDHNAYSNGTLTVTIGGEQKTLAGIGTQFEIQIDDPEKAEEIANLFESNDNCYLGPISAMVRDYENSVDPTCETPGQEAYTLTLTEGSDSATVYVPVPALGHERAWEDRQMDPKEALPTCVDDGYFYDYCLRDGCDETWRLTAEEYPDKTPQQALGHKYEVTGREYAEISAANPGNTVITYTCQNGDQHTNAATKSVTASIAPTTFTMLTTQTLAERESALPQTIVSTEGGITGLSGQLYWDVEDENISLTAGSHLVNVKLDVTSSNLFPDATGLQLQVQVNKDTISFANTYFNNVNRWQQVGDTNPNGDFSVSNPPRGVTKERVEYLYSNTGSNWVTAPPSDTELGEHKVRVVYSYDPAIYEVSSAAYNGYNLTVDESSKTIYYETDYVVRLRSFDNAIIGRLETVPTYNGTAQPTVYVDGAPNDTTVEFKWKPAGAPDDEYTTETESATASSGRILGAKITKAGTYEVVVTLSGEGYGTRTETFTEIVVNKAPVALPDRLSTERYSQGHVQKGVDIDPDSTDYRVLNDPSDPFVAYEGINAGTYTAKLELTDPDNYQWAETEDTNYQISGDKGESLAISWRILRRVVQNVQLTQTSYDYREGTWREPVSNPSSSQPDLPDGLIRDVQYVYVDAESGEVSDSGTTLVAYYYTKQSTAHPGEWVKEEIFRITDARATNAGTYTPVVTLTDPNNYAWSSAAPNLGTWTISPLTIAVRTVVDFTVSDTTYSGTALKGENVQFTEAAKKWFDDRILQLDGISYYTSNQGGSPVEAVQARSYYAYPKLTVLNQNYTLDANYTVALYAKEFDILQAPLSFTAPENTTITYDKTPYTVPEPEYQSGLVNGETSDAYSFRYSYTFTPAGGGEPETRENQTEPPVFTELGTYAVTISVVSNNYQAGPFQYTVTIEPYTGPNTIILDTTEVDTEGGPVESGDTIRKTLGDASFQVKGTVQYDSGSAMISYSPDDPSIATVDKDGNVTILKPGTTKINVDSAATDNIGAGHAEYILVVEKFQPTLTLNAEDYSKLYYDGAELEASDYDYAVFTGLEGYDRETDIQYRFYLNEVDATAGNDHTVTPIDAGSYWLRADYPGDSYYSAAAAVPIQIEIKQADFTVSVVGYGTGDYGTETGRDYAVYDGAAHDIAQITIGGQLWNSAQPGDYQVTIAQKTGDTAPDAGDDSLWSSDLKITNVISGEYWCRVVHTGGNYQPQVRSFSVNLQPKPLEVRFDSLQTSREYQADNVSAGSGAATVSGQAGTETIKATATAVYADDHAETGKTITITYTFEFVNGALPGNYSLDGTAFTQTEETRTDNSKTGTITSKEITVTGVAAQSRPYGGQDDKSVNLTEAEGGLQANGIDPLDQNRFTLTLQPGATGTLATADAGPGKEVIIATLPGDLIVLQDTEGHPGDYIVTGINDVTVDISPRTVGFTPPDNTIASFTGQAVAETYYHAAAIDDSVGAEEITLKQLNYTFYHTNAAGNMDPANPVRGIPSDVGEYWVVVSLPDSVKNFVVDEAKNAWKVTIGKAALEAQIADKTVTFNGQEQPLTGEDGILNITVDSSTLGSYSHYAVSFVAAGSYGSAEAVPDEAWGHGVSSVRNVLDSGTYFYRVTDSLGNHEPDYGEVSITVEPAQFSLSGTMTADKIYDGTTDVSGETASYAITAGKEASGDITGVTLTAQYTDTDASEQPQDISLSYVVTFKDASSRTNYAFDGTATINDATVGGQAAEEDQTITVTAQSSGRIDYRPLTVAVADHTMVYNGTNQIPLEADKLSIPDVQTQLVAGETVTPVPEEGAVGTVASKDVSAGSQTLQVEDPSAAIRLEGEDAANYRVTAVTAGNATITPAPITLTLKDDMQAAYTGSEPARSTYQATIGSVFNSELTDHDVIYTFYQDASKTDPVTPIRVGDYYLVATLNQNSTDPNYQGVSAEGWFRIVEDSEAVLTPIVTAHNAVYDGKEHSAATILIRDLTGEPLTEGEDYTVYYWQESGSEQTATPMVKDVTEQTWNYRIDLFDYPDIPQNSFTAEVTPATLTITPQLEQTEKAYDGTAALTDAQEGALSFQVSTGETGEEITVTGHSAAYDSANATENNGATKIDFIYTVDFGTAKASNYEYAGVPLADGTQQLAGSISGTIAPKEIQVLILDQNQIYDGSDWSGRVGQEETLHWTVPAGAVESPNGTPDVLDIVLSIPADSIHQAIHQGTYPITGVCNNRNYAATFRNQDGSEATGTFTVSRRSITVQIGEDTGIYGEPYTPGTGLLPEEVLVGGDQWTDASFSSIGLAVSPADVGDYPISAQDGDYGDYTIQFVNGTYHVTERPITIRIEDQRSDYGAARSSGIENPVEGTHFTVTSTYQIVANDDLGIQLSTDAGPTQPAGTYAIVPSYTGSDADNYTIIFEGGSWAEEDAYGTYHIDPAELEIGFRTEGEIPISFQDTYENPLHFTNTSAAMPLDDAEIEALWQAGKVKFESSDPATATVDADGTVHILKSGGSVTISAWVEASDNFKAAARQSYTLHIATSSGIRVTFPQQGALTYSGGPQTLLPEPELSPATAQIVYWLDGQSLADATAEIPTGENVGSYTVHFRATADNYDPYEGSVQITIVQNTPADGFEPESRTVAYQDNLSYALEELTELHIRPKYSGTVRYVSSNSSVAEIPDATDPSRILIKGQGDAEITAIFSGDTNYTAGNYTFTLHVRNSETMIGCNADASYTVTYDGDAHGLKLEPGDVTGPASYEIFYSDDGGLSYEAQAPAYTDAGTYIICYQIRADGYEPAEFEQEVIIEAKPIEAAMFRESIGKLYTYIGAPIEPPVSVTYNGMALVEGEDYTLEYGDNTEVGTGTVTVKAVKGSNYSGEDTVTFQIAKREANYLSASMDPTFGFYGTDSASTVITVTFGGEVLEAGVDYTISCADEALAEYVEIDGSTLSFSYAGDFGVVYPIVVTATEDGNYSGSVQLSYTLLTASDPGGLEMTVNGDPDPKVSVYGDEIDGIITVANPNGGEALVERQDYDLTYAYYNSANELVALEDDAYTPDVLEEAGIYVVTATAKNGYEGTGTFVFVIQKRDLMDVSLTVDDAVYTGERVEPAYEVSYPGLTEDDYDAVFQHNLNAGEGELILTASAGSNNFMGSVRETFEIAPKQFTEDFTVDAIADQAYTGAAITPSVVVRDENGTALSATDYEIFYENNIEVGTAKVRIEGRNNYEGEIQDITFEIIGTGYSFQMQVEHTSWTYDPTGVMNVGSITVTYNSNPLTIGTDFTLSVEKDGTVILEQVADLTTVQAAISDPDSYTITAIGTGNYPDLVVSEAVDISKIQPVLTLRADPETMTGGGTIMLSVKAEHLPDNLILQQLSVTKNGEAQEPLALTLTDGIYSAELQVSNENATYVFAVFVAETDYYAAADASVTVLTARRSSGGGGGGGGGHADETPEVLSHTPYLLGYDDGTFRPEGNITRAQVAAIFARLLSEQVEIQTDSASPFTDVPADAWYADSVTSLQEQGILTGRSETIFAPDAPITRAEFVTICTRFDTYAAVDTVNDFSDVSASHWAYAYINYAVHEKWITGYDDGTFRPDDYITRAEAVQVVNRVLGRHADVDSVASYRGDLEPFSDLSDRHWAYFEILEAAIQHDYILNDKQEIWQ